MAVFDEGVGDYVAEPSPSAEDEFFAITGERGWGEALETLTPKQRFVIELRWGLRDSPPMTQREVADLMGIDRAAVHRHEHRALARMRKWA